MPTVRPRHHVTETPDVARALDAAARRWPGESRSQLLRRLIAAGGDAVAPASEAQASQQRREALLASSGSYADAFGPGYLAELRRDWAE